MADFVKKTWVCGETVTADDLNRLEGGVEDALDCCGSGGLEYAKDAPDIDGGKSYAVIENNVEGETPNVASGFGAHAEGGLDFYNGEYDYVPTTASGVSSHAEGIDTTASGGASHAEGSGTTASGEYSHAEGNRTTASDLASHAEGNSTTASGGASHAEGGGTTASGITSHAEGSGTTANHRSQHVFGEYNAADPSTATSEDRGTYIEIVGNGTISNRSNARTLDWDGNETLAGSLTLGSTTLTEALLQQLLAQL